MDDKTRVLFNKSLDAIIVFDGDGLIMHANDACRRVFGYCEKQLAGQHFSVLFPPEAGPGHDEILQDMFSGGVFEGMMLRVNGELCPVSITAAMVLWEGEPAILGTFRDITERIESREKLRHTMWQLEKSRDDLLSILNQLRIGTALTDPRGNVTFLSSMVRRLVGDIDLQARPVSWIQAFGQVGMDTEKLADQLDLPSHKRAKHHAELAGHGGHEYSVEVEVCDDPRDHACKIFLFYDVTEVVNLRRQLEEGVSYHDLIGRSEPMRRMYREIQDVAVVDWIVLLEGDTGTGKELVATAIHQASPRCEGPYVTVNCAGLTDSLLASQLFGHRKGAFTGAVSDQAGLFEAANGGTLFLDEIGDISSNVQNSLLRVLENGEINRLGEATSRKVDVRVIAATNKDLLAEVEKGNFRRDLLYRLKVARIKLPQLCQRREDIPLLVDSFLQKSPPAIARQISQLSPETMQALLEYSWPGNVRELKSAIDFAVLHCSGRVISPHDLPPEVVSLADSQYDLPAISEESRILAAVQQAGGNRSKAAQILGISRATLYRRIADLNLQLAS